MNDTEAQAPINLLIDSSNPTALALVKEIVAQGHAQNEEMEAKAKRQTLEMEAALKAAGIYELAAAHKQAMSDLAEEHNEALAMLIAQIAEATGIDLNQPDISIDTSHLDTLGIAIVEQEDDEPHPLQGLFAAMQGQAVN